MKYTMELGNKILATLNHKLESHFESTSEWNWVVFEYAKMILGNFDEWVEYENDNNSGKEITLNLTTALNGAKSWLQASMGGNYLVWSEDLAEVLKITFEEAQEKGLQIQAKALREAWNEITKAVNFIKACEEYGVNFKQVINH